VHGDKRSFHQAANSVFGEIGSIAPGETVIELLKNVYQFYCTVTCLLKKAYLKSLDFVSDRLL